MQRKGNPSALLVGMQTGVATVENSMEFPQKIKILFLDFKILSLFLKFGMLIMMCLVVGLCVFILIGMLCAS